MIYIENGETDKEFICDPRRTNIFLIGDSIRIGYCETVKREMADCAAVFFVDENCRSTQYVISSLNQWANKFNNRDMVDIVHFNCGHWDIAHWLGHDFSLTSKTEYAKNIEMIISLLKKLFVNAKIIFATTTAMNPDGSQGINVRTNKEILEYNHIAEKIAMNNGVFINDLFKFTSSLKSCDYADYCHLTKSAFENLGRQVSKNLRVFI